MPTFCAAIALAEEHCAPRSVASPPSAWWRPPGRGWLTAGPGDATVLPGGHDARVVSDETVVAIDWSGAGNYAR